MLKRTIKPKKKPVQRAIASIVFRVLGRAVKACYRLDSRVKQEFDGLPEGYVIRLFVKPMGPALYIKKGNGAVFAARESEARPDLDMQFKSIEGALLILTGEKSVAEAFSENRFLVLGDTFLATSFVRIMNVVEAYLFPRIWTAYLFKNQAPKRERSVFRIYAATLFGI